MPLVKVEMLEGKSKEFNGAILSGYEPEFEEADKVADSFEDL